MPSWWIVSGDRLIKKILVLIRDIVHRGLCSIIWTFCLFVVLTSELLTHLFLWLFKWVSVLCGNNRDGLKCEWMVDEDGGWKKNMKWVFFSTFQSPSLPPSKKPYFYPPPLALMYWSGEVVFPLARCRTLKAQLWCSGLWLWMSLRWKVRFSFSSFKANSVVPESAPS